MSSLTPWFFAGLAVVTYLFFFRSPHNPFRFRSAWHIFSRGKVSLTGPRYLLLKPKRGRTPPPSDLIEMLEGTWWRVPSFEEAQTILSSSDATDKTREIYGRNSHTNIPNAFIGYRYIIPTSKKHLEVTALGVVERERSDGSDNENILFIVLERPPQQAFLRRFLFTKSLLRLAR